VSTAPAALPFDDRPPSEGELFSLELLYLLQTDRRRLDHGHWLSVVVAGERRRMRYVSWELWARTRGVAFLAPPEAVWHTWRYHVARTMSDDDLRAELVVAEDRLVRALGQMSLAFRTFENLLAHRATGVPTTRW